MGATLMENVQSEVQCEVESSGVRTLALLPCATVLQVTVHENHAKRYENEDLVARGRTGAGYLVSMAHFAMRL